MDDLYETDVLLWSEEQAAKLRRLAAADRSNTDGPDWPNIIEEIEDVGRSTIRACRSHLVQALLHDLKSEAWPTASYVPHWRAEARAQRDQARDEYTSSMRQRIDLAELYRRALNAMPETMDGQPPLPVPATCPLTLEEWLNVRPAEAAR